MAEKNETSTNDLISEEIISLEGGTIETVAADSVQINQGGARSIVAKDVELNRGSALTIQADNVSMQDSAAFVAQAETINSQGSNTFSSLGDFVKFSESRIGVVIAKEADMENSTSVVLLARQVNGSVDTVLDTRGAALAGIVAGISVGLVIFVGNLLSRRR